MTSTTNITLDADTRVGHTVLDPDRPEYGVAVNVGVAGHAVNVHAVDPADLERLAAECLAAANALRAAKGDTFEGNGQDEDELDAALLADGAA